MFIKTQQYSILEAACGIQIFFDKLFSKPQKVANIISASRVNGISTLGLNQVSETINIGDKVIVSQVDSISTGSNPIPSSYAGNYIISGTGINNSVSYAQSLLPNDANIGVVTGEIYKQPNINPAENYIIEFSIETKVPSNAEVTLRPSSYVVSSNEGFYPSTIIEILSRFSTSAKVLLKLTIRDIKSNNILKTEYREIIVSDSSNKPCEIISTKPIDISYYELNSKNNWSYFHEGYLLAQFIPSLEYKDISVKVVKKNPQLLPSRGGNNKIRIIADPIKLQNKQTTIDKIRSAILAQYDTINNSIAIANLGNKSYDIIVEDKLVKPDDLKDIVIDVVPPVTGVPIKFSDVATAVPYSQDLYTIPQISLIRWNNNNNIRFLGELHYNQQIYSNDTILFKISGTTNLSGSIIDVTNGINYLTYIS